ncbi:phosphatidylglycerophosphatase and protein-tyrosine phosphatase 1-like [Oppia nitens]|uniref:phosphatidylglycerophosphatase and protein-tyrosine phosphatase 1-like n=1 Tax=Oppia nitens TaxID=1686743 RepID=UPI0023DAF463|nr:phosphatidylglycerophosphatase and protein-tyrosine phosphatase 1-like [Oppia nitens]
MTDIFNNMFGRVTFYPTLLYNIFMSKVSTRRWFDRIDDNCILGALPFRSITPQLIKEEKVRGVVSMNEDFELRFWVTTPEEWQQLGIKFLQLNTADILHAPTQDKLNRGVQFMQQFMGTDSSVYVHCKAGRTRSATLVACYLMNKHQWKPQEAVDFMKSKRSHILLRSKQWEAIDKYYDQNITNSSDKQNNINLT